MFVSENYSNNVPFRVTDNQLKQLDREADRAGMKRPEYIRYKLFGPTSRSTTPVADYVTRAEVDEIVKNTPTAEEVARRAADIINGKDNDE